MKKINRELALKIIEDINNIQRDISTSHKMEEDVKHFKIIKSELQELQEKGSIGL